MENAKSIEVVPDTLLRGGQEFNVTMGRASEAEGGPLSLLLRSKLKMLAWLLAVHLLLGVRVPKALRLRLSADHAYQQLHVFS